MFPARFPSAENSSLGAFYHRCYISSQIIDFGCIYVQTAGVAAVLAQKRLSGLSDRQVRLEEQQPPLVSAMRKDICV